MGEGRNTSTLPGTLDPQGSGRAEPSNASPGDFTRAQAAIIAFCADAVQQLGLSRSVGQIFGLIYASPQPLSFNDVVGRLDISAGSVSQGLRLLRELGAIRPVMLEGDRDRREFFTAETELRRLIGRLMRARLRPPLESAGQRLKDLRSMVDASDGPDAPFLRQRVGSLRSWHRKATLLLPFLEAAIGSTKD